MDEQTRLTLGELRRRVGDVSQLASTRAARLTDGSEDGVRIIDARVSGGLSAVILADRGLDLGDVWAAGHQVGWRSTTGVVHPAYSSEHDWLRSFHGGLLTTCGLQNVGLPSEDEGTSHGLHGRISNIPARNVVHRVVEEHGRLVAEVSGEMRETDVFGSDLLLRRRIRLPTGETVVHVEDEVVNQGFAPVPLLILYHVNVGYPVVADGARLLGPAAEVVGRDEAAQAVVGTAIGLVGALALGRLLRGWLWQVSPADPWSLAGAVAALFAVAAAAAWLPARRAARLDPATVFRES